MERILFPDKFVVDPSYPTAKKEYEHWRKTFENFFFPGYGERTSKKLRCLIKCVSASLCEYFTDATTSETAMAI